MNTRYSPGMNASPLTANNYHLNVMKCDRCSYYGPALVVVKEVINS